MTPFEVFTAEMAKTVRRRKRNVERDAAIISDRRAGMTYAAIAAKHNVTEARCNQICAAAGLPKTSTKPWNAETAAGVTVESGQYKGYRIRVARKAGRCDGGGCAVQINGGDHYVEGDGHGTRGPLGFARERLCLKCAGVELLCLKRGGVTE
jgi:hypothetical protein